jgi:hypothetical protein
MLNRLKTCTAWLTGQRVGVIGLVLVGLALCLGLPSLTIVAGIAPLLLLLACLVPCLVPLALLRDRGRR